MNTKGIGALILASFYYIFFRLIWPRISWIFEKEVPVPANWTSVSAAEHFFLRHFDSKKFPGSGNMVTCLKLKIKEDVTWSEFMSRMKLAARAVQMENPTLQVGAAARHRHTRRVKWYWVRQPEIPEIPILVEDQLSWMDVVRRETNTNYPLIGPLMRLVLVKMPEEAGSNPNNFVRDLNVVWSIHHSICDYLSAMSTMFKLFSYLDKPPRQMHPDAEKEKAIQAIPMPKQALKPYSQYLLPRKILYFMQSAFDIKLRNDMPSLPLVKKLPSTRLSLFEQLDFSDKQTANFIAQCKAHSLSPTFVLNALCMIAYHRGVLGSPAKSEKFVSNITIDLRRALPKCSLTESDLCHFSSGAYANTNITKDMDVWTLARKAYNNFISNVKMGIHVTHFLSQDLFSLFNFEDTESPFPFMFGNLKVIKPYYGETLDLLPTGTTAFSIKGISNHVTCYWLATETDGQMHASFTWNNAIEEKNVRNYIQEIKNIFIDIGNGVGVKSAMHEEKPALEITQQTAVRA